MSFAETDIALSQGLAPDNVPAYTIVAGVPARAIRRRFPEDTADRLDALAWWDWEHGQLRVALEDFRKLGVESFLNKYSN